MMKMLLIQDDFTILLQTNHPDFEIIRDRVIRFAEIYQSPDSLYIFRITNLSIWNAAALGYSKHFILDTLKDYSINNIPSHISDKIQEWFDIYGQVKLYTVNDNTLFLYVESEKMRERLLKEKTILPLIENNFLVSDIHRGEIKSRLMKLGIPVEDLAGFKEGEYLNIDLDQNNSMDCRAFQEDAERALYEGGSGVAIAPCGSGKTLIGIKLMSRVKRSTLIVTNNRASTQQWKRALLKLTNLKEDQISIYGSDNKRLAPVTITTYNMIAYKNKGEYVNFKKIKDYNWGLLLGDEIHYAPASTFRVISALQSIRRVGLTATLAREDGREADVFTLIGIKRFEKPWKDLEQQGYIAELDLNEIKVPMSESDRMRYTRAINMRDKFEIAASSENKIRVIEQLLNTHKSESILIIGHFTQQLLDLGKRLNIPVVYGETEDKIREQIYEQVRTGDRKVFIASKVANAALDIPCLSVLIQISFQYSSRNEEAQRQGRITRPNKKVGHSYTLVSEDTVEEIYNRNRMTFLTNEGYTYKVKRIA